MFGSGRPRTVSLASARGGRAGLGSLVLLVGSCGFFGCGDPEPDGRGPRAIPGCERFSYEVCDILDEACQNELFGLVACLREDPNPGAPPPVRLLDEASAAALLGGAPQGSGMMEGLETMAEPSLGEQAFRAQVRGLELLGMLTPGQIEQVSDVIDATIASFVAYYLPAQQEVIVIDRGAPLTGLDANMTLAHELVHAQQDTRHDLQSFGADLEPSSDAALAISSLLEGEASMYEYLIRFAYRGIDLGWIDYSAFFRDLTGAGSQATLEAGSPALTASSIFPYTFGTRYAGALWLDGGSAAVDARYEAPPLGSWDVLTLRAPDVASPIRRFDEAPTPLDGYTFVASDVAGAWVTAAVLSGLAGSAEERATLPARAGRWRGDRLWIYDASEGAPGVVVLWAIEWADAESAALFATLGASLASEGAVLQIDTRGLSSRVVAAERAEDLAAWRERFAEAVP
jgi:hypothetical protein